MAALTDLLADPLSAGQPTVLLGPSGAGKTSVLRAGLVPAVCGGALPGRQPGAPAVLYMTPTGQPVGELRTHDRRRPLDTHSLLVVDQFEELFTLCEAHGERAEFIDRLCRLALDGLPVILGMRADFYGHCLAHPPLLSALRARAFPLGP